MNHQLSRVFDGRVPAAFVLATLGLTLVAEFFMEMVKPFGVSYLLGFGLAALMGAVVIGLRWWQALSAIQWASITSEPSRPARVLVLSASPVPREAETPAQRAAANAHAIRHHAVEPHRALERIYVLYTDDERGKGGRDAVSRFAEALGVLGEDAVRECQLPVGAANDPEPVYQCLLGILEEVWEDGYDSSEVVFDYTGGTSAFTAAMTLVGAALDRRLQYIASERDGHGRPVDGTQQAIEVDLAFDIRVKAGGPAAPAKSSNHRRAR